MSRDRHLVVVGLLLLLACVVDLPLRAQVGMPDPRQVSGVPLPAGDLPSGTVSVRVIRGSFANNVSGTDVTFTVAGQPRTVKTDEAGRAQLTGLARGTSVTAVAMVDGEKLETQSITVGDTGVRFVLAAMGPATKGGVVLGDETYFTAEFNDDRLIFRYFLSVVNAASTPVEIGGPLVFDLPREARGVGIDEATTKKASANGARVIVLGPFAPGTTPVNFSFELPYSGPTAHMEQRMPAPLQSLVFAAFKTGDMDVQSAQLGRKQSVVRNGVPLIIGNGSAIAAGQSFVLDITGLPHRARWPRFLALGLASVIVCAGVWAAAFPPNTRRPRRG